MIGMGVRGDAYRNMTVLRGRGTSRRRKTETEIERAESGRRIFRLREAKNSPARTGTDALRMLMFAIALAPVYDHYKYIDGENYNLKHVYWICHHSQNNENE